MIDLINIVEDIKVDEGFSNKVYSDTLGVDTIGYGFAIKSLYLDDDIGQMILERKVLRLVKTLSKKFEWFDVIEPIAKEVVVNMCYQLGINGFSKFKRTIDLLKCGDYYGASQEILDSLWAAEQTPNRAKKLSDKLASLV